MNRDEFFLRLLLMAGKKPKKIRYLAYSGHIAEVIHQTELVETLAFTPEQVTAFNRIDKHQIEPIFRWLNKDGHHLITLADKNYPLLLREIAGAPLAIFIAGNVQQLDKVQLAMVGSRHHSDYGKRYGYQFAKELAAKGLVITSGLAIGIDRICHQGALDANGVTLAVLGSGHLHLAPRSHYWLAQSIIAEGGAIISEFLPTTPALPVYFPRRNRIISGLSRGVFVVEAAEKSGSLITARYALEQGKEIFALPGAIDNFYSYGTNWLIKQGAQLVLSPSDILEVFNSSLNWLPVIHPVLPVVQEIFPHAEIYRILSSTPLAIDQIAEITGQSVTDVMIKMVELEIMGGVVAVLGGYIKI